MNSVTFRRFLPTDRDWLLEQHQRLYAHDEGFDDTFGLLVAQVLDDFIAHHDPAFERGWVPENSDGPLGSIFCVHRDTDTAQLRIFLLLPEARGLGLGKQLLTLCMDHARAQGYKKMVLWTHESHRAACALYKAFGWQMMDCEPQRSFGQDVVVQNWQFTF